MEEHDLARAALGRRDEGRAVVEASPDLHLGGELGRIGEHLTAHGDVGRCGEPGKESGVVERGERLRKFTGVRVAVVGIARKASLAHGQHAGGQHARRAPQWLDVHVANREQHRQLAAARKDALAY